MNSIRHYLFLVIGLALLSIFVGPEPTAWVALATIVAIVFKNLAGVVYKTNALNSQWRGWLIGIFEFGSLIILFIEAILIFIYFGLIASLGLVMLFFGYFLARESDYDKEKRAVHQLRASLFNYIQQTVQGSLTSDQLEIRALSLLKRDLPRGAFYLTELIL